MQQSTVFRLHALFVSRPELLWSLLQEYWVALWLQLWLSQTPERMLTS